MMMMMIMVLMVIIIIVVITVIKDKATYTRREFRLASYVSRTTLKPRKQWFNS